MILKLYIKKNLFHLPRKQDDLTRMIKELFYKRKTLVKSSLPKMYQISDIENKNIKYEKNVNIFLINLYLLVLQSDEELASDDITITLSDENIISELSKKLDKDLKDLSIEKLEKIIGNYISSEQEKNEQSKTISKGRDAENDQNVDVDFTIAWVKAMDKKIKE